MPFFSRDIKGGQIIINVVVLQPGDNIQKMIHSPQHVYKALVDTGATNTCISQHVAKTVGLLPQSKKLVTSATQSVAVNSYDIDIHIPIERVLSSMSSDGIAQKRSQISVLSSINLQVTELMQQSGFDVLLGMDVLLECSLFISGNHGDPFITFCY